MTVGGGGELRGYECDATDSETPAKKKLRWADFKARKKEKAKASNK